MRIKLVLTISLLLLFILDSSSQSSRLHFNSEKDVFIRKAESYYQVNTNIHTAIQPYRRSDFNAQLNQIEETVLTEVDQINYQNLFHEQALDSLTHKGWLNTFFKNPYHLFQLNHKDFQFTIDPLFNFQVGYDIKSENYIFLNKRGIEIYGSLDQKFYFYSSLHENQSNFKPYIEDYIIQYNAIRGQGNYKDYNSGIFDSVNGFDYGNAQGYLGYLLSKSTSLEIGHSKHKIGHGVRSLLLSDSGQNYFYLKFDARFWKIHYQSIFAELSTISARYNFSNQLLPKKYMAAHYFSIKHKNLELGLFESVIFSRQNQFEFQYLNPVILYRTIEHQLDSPDNVLLGLNVNWNFKTGMSLYGQFILDDINIGELRAGNGWWGNKYGYQLGFHYDHFFGIPNLTCQLEWNQVRPYTYSHWQTDRSFNEISISNYSHFNQPLAHPLGANFSELLLHLNWQPFSKLNVLARLLYTKVGRNSDINFGGDILIPNFSRAGDFNQSQNQGQLSRIANVSLISSYQILPRLYFDLEFQARSDQSETQEQKLSFINLGLRYNVSNTFIDY